MTIRFARAWGVLVAITSVAACSVIVDSSNLTGRAAPSPSPSSGPTADANAPDGSADAATPEAGDASLVPFCRRATHALCADFEGNDLLAGWTGHTEELGGALSLTPDAREGAGALRVTMPRHTAKGYASLERAFVGPWRKVLLDFDAYLDPLSFAVNDTSFGIMCIAYYRGIELQGVCTSIADGAAYFGTKTVAPFPTGRWVHVHDETDPVALTATSSIDGAAFGSDSFALPTATGSTQIVVQIGVLGFNAPSPAASIRFDNVSVDLE